MRAIFVSLFLFLPFVSNAIEASTQEANLEELAETFGHLLVRHVILPMDCNFALEKIVQGMRNEKENKPSPLTEEQYAQTMALLQNKKFEELAAHNLGEANKFLEHNQSKEGVVTLNDKLHYKILEKGQGAIVTATDSPLLHYEGKFIDGTLFASSVEEGQPIILSLTQTIEGFSKGLVGMQEGEKRILYVHPDLAYGQESEHLPPNALLIFEITLLEANAQKELP